MAKTVSDLTHTGQVNSFTGGLNTDLHPLVQPNDTLTDCINGTLITYNGNENMLQNDMGNYALEGSELPDGFIPLGMKEHNGVAYIVSQNPMTKEVQIGSYPSPKLEIFSNNHNSEIDNIDMSINTNVLQQSINFKYLKDTNCLFTQKIIPDSKLLFSQELRPGDYYCISKPVTADFQYQQFYIETDTGSKTNIHPVISNNDEFYPVNWDTIGMLGVSTFINNVTEFTQDVSYIPKEISENIDLESITINNKITFDRIDYVHDDDTVAYVGVLYEIKHRETTDVETIIKLLPITDSLQYSFSCKKSQISFIENENRKYISINAYPILLRKQLTKIGENKYFSKIVSILCYDQWKQTNEITKKSVDSTTFNFQYNVAEDYNCDTINLYMDESSSTFDAEVLHIAENGKLYKTNLSTESIATKTTFTWEQGRYVGKTKFLGDDVIVLQFELNSVKYCVPIFKSMPYDKLKDAYKNFCLVPSTKFLYDQSHVSITEKDKNFVKILDDNIVLESNSKFNIYNYDNIDASYGDVVVGDLTITGVSDDTCAVDVQIENNGSWITLKHYEVTTDESTAKFENVIVNTCIKSSKYSDDKIISHIGQREYLLKSGHVPFAFKSNETDWKTRVQELTGCSNEDFEMLKTYCDINNKKTLYLDKLGGWRNTSFTYSVGDIYGNTTEDKPVCSTFAEWFDILNKYKQLYVPISLHSDLKRAGYFLPIGSDCETNYKTVVDTCAFVSKTPTSIIYDYHDASGYDKNPNLDLIEQYLFGLYTHVFKYTNIKKYNDSFKLIVPDIRRNCRFIVNVSPYIMLSNKRCALRKLNMDFINEFTSECYNFSSYDQIHEQQINNAETNELWNYIEETNNVLIIDNDNLMHSDSNVFIDVPNLEDKFVAIQFNKIDEWLSQVSQSELQLEFKLFVNEFKGLYVEDNKWQWPDVNSNNDCSVAYVVDRYTIIEDSANNIYAGSINFWSTTFSFILAKNKTWKEKDLKCNYWHLFNNTSDAFKWTLYGTEPKTNYKN